MASVQDGACGAATATSMRTTGSDRLRQYAIAAAGAVVASGATGGALAGTVPPDSAASAAGWSFSRTLLNGTLLPQTIFQGDIWGAVGTLLSANVRVVMERNDFPAGNPPFQRRGMFFSQIRWLNATSSTYMYFGANRAAPGAVIDANNTGGGLTGWTFNVGVRSQPIMFESTRAFNATENAAWDPLDRPNILIKSQPERLYLAFQIQQYGNTYYGWFDLGTQEDQDGNLTFTIHAWAYSTGSILVPSAIPGGTGLAALAIGAAGLRGRRRSRN